MKKALAIIAVATALIISGCAAQAAATPAVTVQPGEPSSSDTTDDLILNEYDGLKITAAVLPRKAILPGSVFPVTVTVKNDGDKTISYVMGSGSYTTPDALLADFTDLQPVIPKDRLGIHTSDFATKNLAPGETVSFVVPVLAVEPNGNFDAYTHDLFNEENTYIADLDWAELQNRYPDLVAAKADSYTGTFTFEYAVNAGEIAAALSGPTGYARTEITVGVNG